MKGTPQLNTHPKPGEHEALTRLSRSTLIVRFPPPANARHLSAHRLLRMGGLLPPRWRRRVVIQGLRFWLPG